MIKEIYNGCQIKIEDGLVYYSIYDNGVKIDDGYMQSSVESVCETAKETIDHYKKYPEEYIGQ